MKLPSGTMFNQSKSQIMEKKCYSVNVHYDLCYCFHNIVAESEAEAEELAKERAMNLGTSDCDYCDDSACVVDVDDNIHGEPRATCPSCPHCGTRLVASDLPDYDYYCSQCDEDFYGCEV